MAKQNSTFQCRKFTDGITIQSDFSIKSDWDFMSDDGFILVTSKKKKSNRRKLCHGSLTAIMNKLSLNCDEIDESDFPKILDRIDSKRYHVKSLFNTCICP